MVTVIWIEVIINLLLLLVASINTLVAPYSKGYQKFNVSSSKDELKFLDKIS